MAFEPRGWEAEQVVRLECEERQNYPNSRMTWNVMTGRLIHKPHTSPGQPSLDTLLESV